MKRILLLTLLMASCNCFATRIYVNPLATGSNDGSSWTNAYTNLQYGLDLAQTGDSVLVAAGIYRKSTPYTSTNNYFYRIFNGGITVLGGYPISGNPTDAQRDWVNNPTIFSGEIINFNYASYVLLVENRNTVVLDGFIMRNLETVGVKIDNSQGIIIKNTLFETNNYLPIQITNSSVTFANCVIFNNQTSLVYSSANANTSFYNCVVANNTSSVELIRNENGLLNMYNCTIVNNKGIPVYGNGTGATVIKNSIFWGNRRNDWFENSDIKSVNHTMQVSYSITEIYSDNNTNTLLPNRHPRFMNQLQPAGADNKFFTADDGLQLTAPCSPALNYGDNNLPLPTTTDIIGNPRIFNAGTIDLGAYEMQQMPGPHLNTVYVNNSAGNTGTHDGSSWSNAFTTLQEALLYCADTVKVAAGTYLTTNSWMDSVFNIETGRVVLGGYPATGNPSDADRDPKLHYTILKGNYSAIPTGRPSPAVTAYFTDSTTILDGFRFTNKGSTGSSLDNVNAVAAGYGSKLKIMNCDFRTDAALGIETTGLYISASSPYIYKCDFGNPKHGNSAISVSEQAHPIFASCTIQAHTLEVINASATLDSCVFRKEKSEVSTTFMSSNNAVLNVSNCLFYGIDHGGTFMYNANKTTGVVTGCVFRNTSVFYSYSAVYNDNSSLIFNKCLFDSCRLVMQNFNRSAPVLNNCLSVHGRFMYNKRSFPVVNNCTVVNTWIPLQSLDGLTRSSLVVNVDSSVLRANNTIFWSLKLNPGILDFDNSVGSMVPSATITTNCLTQNYGTHGQNGNIVGKTPRFNRLDHIVGADGKLFTADDGLQLAPCSPAVNAGNAALGTIFATDVLNNPRIAQTVIDMGAYELQQQAGSTGNYYVNSAASGNNTGTSWNDAYTNLQTALCNSCADTIRVAAGTYKPAVNKRDSTFMITRPLALYGGYSNTGNPAPNDRDAAKYPTILSGNIGSPTDSLDNSGLVVFVNAVTDSVHIDGFVIRDAYNSGGLTANAEGGGGMCILYSNAGVYNCNFINNRANPFGGGLSNGTYSNTTVGRCIFINNSASSNAGGLYSRSNLRLTGCVFENNYAQVQGGAVGVAGRFNISNSLFYRNYTTFPNTSGVGGGIYAGAGGYINNCTFVENKCVATLQGGGGIFTNQSRNIEIRNCIFNGNMTGTTTTDYGADFDWQGSYTQPFNCILQYSRPYPLPAMRNIVTTNAGFRALNDPKGPDGIWLTQDDGLQLNYNSPAFNLGRNDVVQDLPVDIMGDARVVLDTVDAGAYEYQDRPLARAGSDTLICAGDPVKIGLDANPKHTYSWTSNPVGFTSTAINPVVNPLVLTDYFLEVTKGAEVMRDTVQIGMRSAVQPAVSASLNSTTVCAGSDAIFTATPLYGGVHPSYEWRVNGVKAGTDTAVFSAVLQQGDQVSVLLTSSASCASPATVTSNIITLKVKPLGEPQVTIVGPVSICTGDTVTYKATSVNGGQQPMFQWVKNGWIDPITADSTYTISGITAQTDIFVKMYSNSTTVCLTKGADTSNVLTIVPKPTVTPSVSVAASYNAVCGARPVTFTAQGVNGGSNPLWQWKVNGNNVGTNSNLYTNSALASGDKVYVAMTSNADCPTDRIVESNRVTMAQQTVINPAISITATQTEVKQDSIISVMANVVNSNGSVTYQWYDSTSTHYWQAISGAITQTIGYAPHQTGDKIRCVAQTVNNCGDAVAVQSAPVTFKINTITGIDAVSAANYGITYWPNPVNTYMVIDGLKLMDQWQTLDIMSVDGHQKILFQSVTNQTRVTLNTSSLKAGFYIGILRKKNGEMVYIKFVKQ